MSVQAHMPCRCLPAGDERVDSPETSPNSFTAARDLTLGMPPYIITAAQAQQTAASATYSPEPHGVVLSPKMAGTTAAWPAQDAGTAQYILHGDVDGMEGSTAAVAARPGRFVSFLDESQGPPERVRLAPSELQRQLNDSLKR